MKLSTRTKYGVLAILELARNYGNGPLHLKTIAQRQGLSVKYLEQLMAVLKSAGIVSSIRGSKGGYILAKKPEEVRVSECFNCLEGSVLTAECVGNEKYCPRMANCAARGLWTELEGAIMEVLESVTLQDLIDRAPKSEIPDYNI